MFDFPEIFTLPLGEWINIAVDWLTVSLAPLFNVITAAIRTPLVYIERFLWLIPWWVLILILAGIAWKTAKHWVAMVTVIGLIFIGLVGLWDHTMTTLAIIVTSVGVSVLIGIPLGITAAKNDRTTQLRCVLFGIRHRIDQQRSLGNG